MKLISYPEDYSPLLADNFFHFEGADPAVSTEIYFFSEEGEPLGARRYAGRSEIDSSPRAILKRTLNPGPAERLALGVVRPEGREVGLSVAVGEGGDRGPVVRFAANLLPLLSSAVVGPAEQTRRLSPADYDEVSLLLAEGERLTVECAAEGEGEWVSLPVSFECERAGLYVLVFTAESLLAAAPSALQRGEMVLRVKIDGDTKAHIRLLLCPASRNNHRVAWLDAYGAIRHHTFDTQSVERVGVERSESDTLRGTLTLGVESWRSVGLHSGPLSQAEMDYLKGVVCSPRVWLLEGDEWVECCVEESVCRCGVAEVLSLSLTLRPSRKSRVW